MDAAPLLLSTGWAAGVNAYMTVLLLGIFGRLGLGDVPDGLESPAVMAAAAGLYSIEFVTDKIPYVDHLWDAVHTVLRPAIAAVCLTAAFVVAARQMGYSAGARWSASGRRPPRSIRSMATKKSTTRTRA